MIDIGLTNALAQIRDALYEINDTLASRGGADMICKYRDAENHFEALAKVETDYWQNPNDYLLEPKDTTFE